MLAVAVDHCRIDVRTFATGIIGVAGVVTVGLSVFAELRLEPCFLALAPVGGCRSGRGGCVVGGTEGRCDVCVDPEGPESVVEVEDEEAGQWEIVCERGGDRWGGD